VEPHPHAVMSEPGQSVPMRVVAHEGEVAVLTRDAGRAGRLAVDLEASGMFAYRAAICTVQLAWQSGQSLAVVDVLTAPLDGLRDLLGTGGPTKIVHDVAFDARLLAESGIALGNVHDTAIAAHMLGRAATGLSSLLASELGIHIGKAMQHHDWRQRPLDDEMLAYLGADVAHLEALEEVLWREVRGRGIEDEVLEETRYRLASAAAAAATQAVPPYARIKGVAALPERDRAALRVLAELREHEARQRDVPPHRVISAETLVAIARARPRTAAAVARVRGVSTSSSAALAFVDEVARVVAAAGESIPGEEHALFARPPLAPTEARARRERETRILAWRRAEALRRGVDEQVVLPGHCAKDVVGGPVATLDELARVPGIGQFRVNRDGDAILRALRGETLQGAAEEVGPM
jgi:ribonuclease D